MDLGPYGFFILRGLQLFSDKTTGSLTAGPCRLGPDEKEAEQGLVLPKPHSPPTPDRCCELAESVGQGSHLDLTLGSFPPSDYST